MEFIKCIATLFNCIFEIQKPLLFYGLCNNCRSIGRHARSLIFFIFNYKLLLQLNIENGTCQNAHLVNHYLLNVHLVNSGLYYFMDCATIADY